MRKKCKNGKGITLIALVITIIILLILAGVTIAALSGDNGILTKALEAKITTQTANEKEAILLSLTEYQLDEQDNAKLGTTLYDKTAENSTIWNLIIKDNTTYGTNWNYIEKGTSIEGYGEIQNNWLINYENGEIIELKEGEYTHLRHGENIGVTEGLIFNLDPSIIDTIDIEDLKMENYESLWKDTELIGFNWTEESGLKSNEFNFDGVDDYIKVKYSKEEEKNTLAANGFTFEYYGIVSKGNSYDVNKSLINYPYNGIFGYWNGNENIQARLRFGMADDYFLDASKKPIRWNAGYDTSISDFAPETNSPWNIWYPIDFEYGNEIYYTITLDTSNSYEKDGEEYYKQILYINGEKIYDGGYNKKQWENFVNNELDKLNYFCIGRCSMGSEGWWHYSKLNAYALRLYNHALTSEQVKDNYQKSVIYHETLQQ